MGHLLRLRETKSGNILENSLNKCSIPPAIGYAYPGKV